MAAPNGGHERKPGPDWVERTATALSFLLVLGVVAVLGWDAAHSDRPPALDASAGSPMAVGREWHVPIIVRNTGDVAVQEVGVRVTLERPDTVASDIDIRIDWLPGRSQREVDAVFAADPSRGKLTVQVQSFDAP
ncbi:MAG: hypothetical protein ACJ79K_18355 [Gemmatimonadaceae bacterium]